jgi:hypothetical protein
VIILGTMNRMTLFLHSKCDKSKEKKDKYKREKRNTRENS